MLLDLETMRALSAIARDAAEGSGGHSVDSISSNSRKDVLSTLTPSDRTLLWLMEMASEPEFLTILSIAAMTAKRC